MINLRLKEIADLAGGVVNNEKFNDLNVSQISIDTRTIFEGEMYMPIIGEKLDGHLFIDNAFEKGAIATFSKRGEIEDSDERPIVWVDDTNKAFTNLAQNYRISLDIKIIGITGSNGKTTTKDLISNVLESKYSVKKTFGNLNNEIGVPRTLLSFSKDTNIGVVEMGTDGFGQIEALTKMASPDIAIITNIGDSHLEQLKTKENIAIEKLHIIDGLKEDGIFLFNNDDEILKSEFKKIDMDKKVISYGMNEDSDYVIKILKSSQFGTKFSINGKEFSIELLGTHQVYNATVAYIIGELFEISDTDIQEGLNKKDRTKMRSELMSCHGFDILNDSYKSNPQSLRSGLETLELLTGYSRKIAILADMLELGNGEIELHRQIGREIDPTKIDYLLLYGPLSKYIYNESVKNFLPTRVFYFDTKDKLIDKAKYIVSKNSIVFVKGSRSMKLEDVVEVLVDMKFE
ncbi:UDP-N-acetylmuramoyl-tripeptide--D-alanyl-D-alanine ligase [Helcococcus kunzii]